MAFRLIWRNVTAKPFRFLLTCSAVTLGVMFTVGVFVFTDSLRATFGDLADDIQGNFDIQVRSEIPFGERIDAPQVPVELGDTLAAIEGVEAVQPRIISFNTIAIDGEGEAQVTLGPPNLGVNWESDTPNPRLFVREGREPRSSTEMAMDVDAFADGTFEIGGTYTVLTNDSPLNFELVGTFSFADPETNALVGAKLIAFDTESALEILNRNEGYDDLTVVAAEDQDVGIVLARVQAALPDGFEALTSEAAADEQAQDFDDFISQFQTFLLVFAFIILLVSAFVIYNVFSILVGQRIRELGLLRAIGATGRQVTTALLGEAAIVALFSTVVGIATGIGLGWTLRWLLSRFEFAPPGNDLLLEPVTFIWGAIVGVGVTIVSAIVPSFRARDISPMAALRSDARLVHRQPGVNTVLGGAIVIVSWLILLFALISDNWQLVLLLGPIAAFGNTIGSRRLNLAVARYSTAAFGIAMLLLSLILDLGTGTVLVLLGVAAGTTFLGVASISPTWAPDIVGALGRWPLAILLLLVGVPLTLLGTAATVGGAVLFVIRFVALLTDPGFAAGVEFVGFGGAIAFALILLALGLRCIDTSFILGWRIPQVIAAIFVFLVGAVGVVLALTGLAGLLTLETAEIALLPVGVVLLGAATWLRRFLPTSMRANARMARENSRRNPDRTASAATALMIGLALVSTATVVASSFKATFADILSDSVTSDWFISGNAQGDPTFNFSTDLARDLDMLDETDTVVRYRFSFEAYRTVVDQEVQDSSATDLANSLEHLDPDFVELDESLIGRDTIWIHEDFAADNLLKIGDSFEIEFPDQVVETVTVGGIFSDSSIYGNRVISLELWQDRYPTGGDQFLSVTTADGIDDDRARAAILAITDSYPQLNVDSREEFQERQENSIDQALVVINVLLLVAIVIALLGIAITLALSVFERTRELGLVRAVGMTSRQMTRMVLFEGAIIAVFGGFFGLILGTLFGAAAVQVIPDAFISTLDIPVTDLMQYLAIAAIAGIGAAMVPARRAARLNVLDAISHE